MSDILATSEELSKIIERAVNRIGENHALARDNEGLTLTNKDTIVIEEALEDAATDMAEKMVLENNINSIVKEQVKAIGGGSGFISSQGGSVSLAKFTKRQEMGEQTTMLNSAKSNYYNVEKRLKSLYERLKKKINQDAKSNELLKNLQKIEKLVRAGSLRGTALDQALKELPELFNDRTELRKPFTQVMKLLEKSQIIGDSEEKSEEEVEEATTSGMAGAFVAPLSKDEEVSVNESTTNTIKKLVRKKLNEAKNVSIPGYEKFEKSRKESTKETKAYHKDFEKKFKDYGDFKGNDDPKFPFAEHSKENADGQYQYYRNDETQDEFVDDWRGMGLEDADGVGDIGRLSDYLEGSSETGNAQVDKDGTPLGNVVPSELGEKIKKKINRKKEKIEAQQRAMSNDKRYSPDVQKVKQVKEGVNTEISNMKKLWSYSKKTQ